MDHEITKIKLQRKRRTFLVEHERGRARFGITKR